MMMILQCYIGKCTILSLFHLLLIFYSERRIVSPEEHSPVTQALARDYGLKSPPSPKLITDLNEKQHYKIHYLNLKEALDLGAELVTIHSAVRFEQKPWLKQYIEHNNNK